MARFGQLVIPELFTLLNPSSSMTSIGLEEQFFKEGVLEEGPTMPTHVIQCLANTLEVDHYVCITRRIQHRDDSVLKDGFGVLQTIHNQVARRNEVQIGLGIHELVGVLLS